LGGRFPGHWIEEARAGTSVAINREGVFPGKADRRGQYGKWRNEGVPVRQKTGNRGPVIKPVGVRSPIADPWESGVQ